MIELLKLISVPRFPDDDDGDGDGDDNGDDDGDGDDDDDDDNDVLHRDFWKFSNTNLHNGFQTYLEQ